VDIIWHCKDHEKWLELGIALINYVQSTILWHVCIEETVYDINDTIQPQVVLPSIL
jgi:hypothetical protein